MQAVPRPRCAPLSSIQHRIHVGEPLPVNVRHADGTLLLARAHVIESDSQLQALIERGATVDILEMQALRLARHDIRDAARHELPQLWTHTLHQLELTFHAPSPSAVAFPQALDAAAEPVLALIDRDPDLAIFQVVADERADRRHGVARALHAAVATHLAVGVLNWSAQEQLRAVKAALTMNLSMLDVQGELARQTTPITPLQREVIQAHPQRSRELLERYGITDADWLTAVEHHHHHHADGSSVRGEADAIASLIQAADVYTSMLSNRAMRDALLPDEAARRLFAGSRRNAYAAALVKAFGLYPPGCHVRLASGEGAIVIERGEAANTPLVVAWSDAQGAPLLQLKRYDTARPEHAVRHVLPSPASARALSPALLMAAA